MTTTNLPNNPFPERTIELRIEIIDADNFKMGAKGYVLESQLTDLRIDPREVLFKALQEIAQQIVREAFKEGTREEALARLAHIDPRNANLREAQNEAIADMAKLLQKKGDL